MSSETRASGSTVFVSVDDDVLRDALTRRLERDGKFTLRRGRPNGSTGSPAVLLSTTADLSSIESAILARDGVVPVVLAALPSEFQREQYERADAIYLPMDLDTLPLLRVLEGLARRQANAAAPAQAPNPTPTRA